MVGSWLVCTSFDIWTSQSGPNPSVFSNFDLGMCFAQQRRALFRHLNVKKWSELVRFVTLLTWKCPSCHIGVHFFDILTSKSGPDLVCFVHFDLEMRFAPQGRALFRQLNFQKRRASRHNGVQFFISHLVRWLCTRCFSEPTFRPSGATNHWKKHSESRLSYLFAHLHLLTSHSFSSLIFSLLGFSSLALPTSAFPSFHIVGSLTSKLPSITMLLLLSM